MVGRMAKIKAPVTVLKLREKSKVDGMHAMGNPPGLYLCVKGQSRTWMLRYVSNGKRREMSLGRMAEVSLENAREAARNERAKVRAGIDPIDEKRGAKQADTVAKAKRITFDQCAEKYIAAHEAGWKNPKHLQQWKNTLATYASPIIGALPVESVDTHLVMQVLEPIWASKNETAARLRGRIESILDWATVRKNRQGDNPARWKGHLDVLLPAKGKVAPRGHHAALGYKELAGFMLALRQMEGIGARALEFAILTAARSGEVRGATWAEFDLEARIWIIPPERMKAKKEHRVSLSDDALQLLKALPKFEDCQIVFPGRSNKPLSDMSLTAVLRRMDRGDLTAHGFRSTFRDWAAEQTAYPAEVVEMALAHAVGNKVEAAYRRGDLFEKRARLMADWAKYCGTVQAPVGNVVAMRRA